MAVSYKRLFHLLIERDMTTTQLQQQAGFSSNIVPRILTKTQRISNRKEPHSGVLNPVVWLFRSQFVIWTYRTFYGIVSRYKEV